MNYRSVADDYRRLLTAELLPWWLMHAMDEVYGGMYTCINNDGTIASHDKYVWSQARALWMFSAAYNRIQPDPTYLRAADQLFGFLRDHGRTDQGEWMFLLSREGQRIEGPTSIQTDAFALCAMVEYSKVVGREQAIDMAMDTYRCTLGRLRRPGSYQTMPYPIPEGTKAHRVSMQFSLAYWELGKAVSDDDIKAEGMARTDDVLNHFYQPELKSTFEYLSLDNNLLAPPIGTLIGPGHGIETAWFQIENVRHTADRQRLEKALHVMRYSFERGWDEEYGGLFLYVDHSGKEAYLPHATTKPSWPHSETLCGALMAHEICEEPWCLEWYQRVHEWAFSHYPNAEHGEWNHRLDRSGEPINTVISLPTKDPFHLSRAFIYAIETLDRLQLQHCEV